MCKRKFGQILRTRDRTCDLSKENRARREENQMWLVALEGGSEANWSVRRGRLLTVAKARCWDKRVTKSHRIPLPERGLTVWTTVWMALNSLKAKELAERVGFEPTLPFRVNTLSKRAPLATRPSLRGFKDLRFFPQIESARFEGNHVEKTPRVYQRTPVRHECFSHNNTVVHACAEVARQ